MSDLDTARSFLETVQPDLDQLLTALDQLGVTLAVIEAQPGDLDRLRANLDDAIAQAQGTWLELTAGGARPEDLAPLTARARALLDAGGVAIAQLRVHIAKLQDAFDALRGRLDAARPGLEH